MTELRPQERACLRYLARNPDSSPPHFSTVLLEGLMARGLLERSRSLSLPPLPAQNRYRLTPRGRRVLRSIPGD
jgi:hypothetical protein